MKTYILQKDISAPNYPFIPSGTEFVKENGAHRDIAYVADYNYTLHPDLVENNPEWFKLKEEEPKKPYAYSNYWEADFSLITFAIRNFEGDINKETQVKITNERLAEILMAESKGELILTGSKEYIKTLIDKMNKEPIQFGCPPKQFTE